MTVARRTIAGRVPAILLFASTAVAQPQPPTNAPRPPDRFASVYPNRVTKLVYLDAAEDWARGHKLMTDAHIPYPPYTNDFEQQINTLQSRLDFTKVTTPALAFFVIFDAGYGEQSDAVLCPGCTSDV